MSDRPRFEVLPPERDPRTAAPPSRRPRELVLEVGADGRARQVNEASSSSSARPQVSGTELARAAGGLADFAREHPFVAAGVAIGAGFLLAELFRATGARAPAASPELSTGAESPPASSGQDGTPA